MQCTPRYTHTSYALGKNRFTTRLEYRYGYIVCREYRSKQPQKKNTHLSIAEARIDAAALYPTDLDTRSLQIFVSMRPMCDTNKNRITQTHIQMNNNTTTSKFLFLNICNQLLRPAIRSHIRSFKKNTLTQGT